MKVAIVNDYLNQYGGQEKVVEALCEIFPEAPIFTSIYDPEKMSDIINSRKIYTSFMQKLPFWKKHFKKYFLLYPIAFEQFDLSGYDVVISSCSAWSKGVITDPETLHICYCHTPMRYCWRYFDYIKNEKILTIFRIILPYFVHKIRIWDIISSNRVDYFISNSNTVKKRIEKFYKRNSYIIHPPIQANKFGRSEIDEGYFLIVSRLNAYKRIDLAIKACNQLKEELKIIGTGPYQNELRKIAGSTVEFIGYVSDERLIEYYQKCKGLIFPGEEDFGIVSVEAQATGKPVIAFEGGGALETVIDGKTGVFFREANSESLSQAIKRFNGLSFNKEEIINNAKRFDKEIFKNKITKFIKEKYEEFWSKKF